MREITTSEFSNAQYLPGQWAFMIILILIFFAIPLGIILCHFFVDSPDAKITFKSLKKAAYYLFFLIVFPAIPLFLLYSVSLEIRDYISNQVEVIDITITKEQLIKNAKKIYIQQDGLSPEYVTKNKTYFFGQIDSKSFYSIIDNRWDLGELPLKARLWRSKYSKRTLKLELLDKQKTFSINEVHK